MKISKNYERINIFIASILVIICTSCTTSMRIHTTGPKITEKNIVFLSPHPDDSPLTFGGMIQNNDGFSGQKKLILIYEPFDMTNYTVDKGPAVFTNEQVKEATKTRLGEDYAAYNELFHSWDLYQFNGKLYPELTLRRYIARKNSDIISVGEEISPIDNKKIHFTNEDLIYYKKIYQDLLVLLRQKNCAAFAPSAVGNERFVSHPDHVLLREAIIQAAHDLSLKQTPDNICQIYFGEDQPYTNGQLDVSLKFIDNFRKRLGNIDKKYVVQYKIDKEKKLELFKTNYKSQFGESYQNALLKRDDERFYIWPKEQYVTVTTNIKFVEKQN